MHGESSLQQLVEERVDPGRDVVPGQMHRLRDLLGD
jgi:hypothetical protein